MENAQLLKTEFSGCTASPVQYYQFCTVAHVAAFVTHGALIALTKCLAWCLAHRWRTYRLFPLPGSCSFWASPH